MKGYLGISGPGFGASAEWPYSDQLPQAKIIGCDPRGLRATTALDHQGEPLNSAASPKSQGSHSNTVLE